MNLSTKLALAAVAGVTLGLALGSRPKSQSATTSSQDGFRDAEWHREMSYPRFRGVVTTMRYHADRYPIIERSTVREWADYMDGLIEEAIR